MSLDGRINIVIQELAPKKTRITVNARYILTKDILYEPDHEHMNESISFGTNGSATFPKGGTKCYANGKLEKEILKIMGMGK